jgi:MbtH protein
MDDVDTLEYVVVVNSRRQYSIWPAHREMPTGWEALGAPTARDECLSWIEENWTDIRPMQSSESDDRGH